MEFAEFELMNSIGAILNHSAAIEFSAEIVVNKCEVKPDEDIFYIYNEITFFFVSALKSDPLEIIA